MQFTSIWTINRTLLGVTTLGLGGPGSNGNEEVLCILQSLSITGTSPSDCLVSYPGHSFGWGLTPLQRCSQCILQSQPTGQIFTWIYTHTHTYNCIYIHVDMYIYIYTYIYRDLYLHVCIYLQIYIYISDGEYSNNILPK